MEQLSGEMIYWVISIGLLMGLIIDALMGRRGVGLKMNLLGGVVGALAVGFSVLVLGLYAPLIYTAIGSLAFLFLCNIFSVHPNESDEATTG